MSENPYEELESKLRGLSWWSGPAPSLWKRALAASRSAGARGRSRLSRVLTSRWPWIATPIAAVILAAIMLPRLRVDPRIQAAANLGGVASVMNDPMISQLRDGADQIQWQYADGDGKPQVSYGYGIPYGRGGEGRAVQSGQFERWNDAYNFSVAGTQAGKPAVGTSVAPATPERTGAAAYDRQVIRKGSIDLESDDVRGVYIKIQKLVPLEASGEYVEQAQISGGTGLQQIGGTGPQLNAYLTLRVRGDRLGQVLNSLGALADVLREQTEATDVTSQVIDVDARLRNERRVEKELLDLLDKRKDSPLQDVLKVSESLSAVRERIEKLTAEQEHLAHQVSLATVVVTIRSKGAPAPATGLGHELRDRMSAAWTGGLSLLIAIVAGLTQTLIGGLVLWIALIIAIVLLRRWYLRTHAGEAPAPH